MSVSVLTLLKLIGIKSYLVFIFCVCCAGFWSEVNTLHELGPKTFTVDRANFSVHKVFWGVSFGSCFLFLCNSENLNIMKGIAVFAGFECIPWDIELVWNKVNHSYKMVLQV